MSGELHLVGSIPLDTPEDVFRPFGATLALSPDRGGEEKSRKRAKHGTMETPSRAEART